MTLTVPPAASGVTQPATPFVLLVDDHEISLETLRRVVETAGHDCVAASVSSEALAYCDDHRPTVVVTDLAMPKLDGQELARWFKAKYPTVPILLVTGESLDDDTVADLRSTFCAVLSKPIEVESFLSLLDGLMTGQFDSSRLDRVAHATIRCSGSMNRGA